MPRWGFTKEMRETEPWGLPEAQLESGKVFTDPIQGDIHLTQLELQIVNSRPFQRLRRVRQLGTTPLVYPGATHTRFVHSLGALQKVQHLLDLAVDQGEGPHGMPDLISQWRADETFDEDLARATVLARLGALLHDICHIPFGHSIEDDMGILESHDKNKLRLDAVWKQFDKDLRDLLEPVRSELVPMIAPAVAAKSRGVEKDELPEDLPYPFVADLVGNTICADLIDYLVRDHYYTGLPMRLGHRFLDSFFITDDGPQEFYRQRMALNLTREDGTERPDTVSELLKYLRYRYELTERVLTHHAKLRADAMVGKMLLLWRDQLVKEKGGDPDNLEPSSDEAKAAKKEIEAVMLDHGDDGLLEHLAREGADHATNEAAWRWSAVRELAVGVQNRELFNRAGRCSATDAPAQKLVSKYHDDPEARLELERDLAHFTGVPAWKVAVWLPPREMGLKIARVLIHDGSTVTPFNLYEENGRRRGQEIDDAHRNLWAISLFTHPDITEDEQELIRAFLAERFGIRWQMDAADHALPPKQWVDELAARRIQEERKLVWDVEEFLREAEAVQARSGDDRERSTFAARLKALEAFADEYKPEEKGG